MIYFILVFFFVSSYVLLFQSLYLSKPSHVATVAMKGNIFDVALRTNPFDVGSNNLSRSIFQTFCNLRRLEYSLCEIYLIDLIRMNLVQKVVLSDCFI